DYVWPRATAHAVREFLAEQGAELCDEIYVQLGTQDFTGPLRRIERSRCDGVLMLLVGDDAVAFNRAFGAAGLTQLRFSPLMDENMLLASGTEGTRGLFASAGFFETLPTVDGLDFGARYHRRFGPQAPPLNSMGESCYEGVRLLGELFRRSGATDVRKMNAVAEGLGYDGPRGPVEVRDRHLRQRVFLAAADGLEFDVLFQLSSSQLHHIEIVNTGRFDPAAPGGRPRARRGPPAPKTSLITSTAARSVAREPARRRIHRAIP